MGFGKAELSIRAASHISTRCVQVLQDRNASGREGIVLAPCYQGVS